MPVTALGALTMELGEAPIWVPHRSELLVVDIFGRNIHRIAHQLSAIDSDFRSSWSLKESISTDSDVGAAVSLADGSLISVEARGFVHIAGGKAQRLFAIPGVTSNDFRANDAKLGPDGRIYVGVLDYDLTEGAGSLWAVDRGGESELMLEGLTIPNGMDWWQGTMWFVNGPEPIVQAYETKTGGLVPSRHIATDATPDGIAIDSDGNIWVALWGQARVDCFSQDGELIDQVSVPTSQPTSVAFCGPNLTTLAITTATYSMTTAQRIASPQAGDVFFADVTALGRESHCDWTG